MKIKFSPVGWNERCGVDALPDTTIEYVGENSLKLDGKLFEFDPNSVEWDTEGLLAATDSYIAHAHRDDLGELWIMVRRFYTGDCSEWDTGDYHAFDR